LDEPGSVAVIWHQSYEGDDKANEGRTRNNLANTLRKLRRLDEARQEIRRAIECKGQFGHASEPWKSWSILAAIETDAGNAAAATEAQGKAIACYLAYRRDGGENHDGPGRLSLAVTQALRSGKSAEVATLLQQRAADPEARGCCPSSAPSRPSSPAGATPPSPISRNWITPWPPKSFC
jgi:hypothetical protein